MYFTLNHQALVLSLMYSPTQNIGLSYLLYSDDILAVQLAVQILLIARPIVARDRTYLVRPSVKTDRRWVRKAIYVGSCAGRLEDKQLATDRCDRSSACWSASLIEEEKTLKSRILHILTTFPRVLQSLI